MMELEFLLMLGEQNKEPQPGQIAISGEEVYKPALWKVMKRSLRACYTTIETTGPNRVLSRDYCLFSDNFWLQYMNQSMLLEGLGVSLNLRKPSVYLRGFLIAQLEKMNSRVTFFTQNMVYELMSHKSTQTGKLLF